MKLGLQASAGPARVVKAGPVVGAGITRRGFVLVVLLLLATLIAGPIRADAVKESVIYHGNTESKIFHRPGCQHYNCKKCTAVFDSREKAINAGYRPCKVCKP